MMPRINPVDGKTENIDTTELLAMVKRKMGRVPNLISTMANSNAVVRAYLGFSQALSTGFLSPRLREQIALVTGEVNGCSYCVAAHTVLGVGAGLTKEEAIDARRGSSANKKEKIALEFVKEVVQNRGKIDDSSIERVKQAGYTDGEICEIVANIALNIYTNYFNLVAGTAIDFPDAPVLEAA